ncbi:hypothetical protein DFR70_101846 [Nocardia tenerifensis]|uniref:Uncharacterized protein n=1 Tax=Nocardia tenerifensis TaxID=228006 RepID=A0A318KGW4_9NOCA|nr:hypothetical protein [Nocardia tenerifensis]PXX71423.1 hypothetical protein DFR70_101846 [Nocardia tenerifensis]
MFGAHLVRLDLGFVERGEQADPLLLEIAAESTDRESVQELRSALRSHRGGTPVRLVLCYRDRRTVLAVDDYPVTVSSALLGELRAVRGVKVLREATRITAAGLANTPGGY